ncbi:SNF2 family N-terminal domain-containing protein [Hypoxylon trugodes]|uniref:SNF2 family N-terminal domain-containing protein n=1 Tax=Hypoxylon trugodes TaxID=326681 RepID=UPI00218D6CF3|nr:SNF2 family N-terminal domain-containing protein [Hypoxylon trugodes]KAI1384871.1 SNF2 family N-terminal domain-containing protein [Hypoxylon trugodes]
MALDSDNEDGSKTAPSQQINEIMQRASSGEPDVETDALGATDEASALKDLTANVRDQDDLERDISYQTNLRLIENENQRDEKRIEKIQASIKKLETEKKTLDEQARKALSRPQHKQSLREKIARIESDIELANKEIADFRARIEERQEEGHDFEQIKSGNKKLPNETHREFLIRTGKITPFANIGGPRPQGVEGRLADVLIDAEDEAAAAELEEQAGYAPQSHQNLRAPGFNEEPDIIPTAVESEFTLRPRKKRKAKRETVSSDEFEPQASDAPDVDFIDRDSEEDQVRRPKKKSRKGTKKEGGEEKEDVSHIDDGNEASYQTRLADWIGRRSRARRRRRQEKRENEGLDESDSDDEKEEWFKPSPDHPSHRFENGLKLPGDIFPALYDYQKTGVQWLSELYNRKVGGIVGDEMGLGKTIQIISFLAALHHSKRLDKPVVVVAPATVLTQWVTEFHRWWPPFRVSILHSSGSGMLNVRAEASIEDEDDQWDEAGNKKVSRAAQKIADRVVKHGHILVTTYKGLQTYARVLTTVEWGYAVLDEGHMIKNPNSTLTINTKELRTPNRIILSGTPMQNNLMELWSLFDFVYPMKLGTLIDFRNEFEIPIRIGGYANASILQIMTAQKCAEILRDTIRPFLLQRMKSDVAADLPAKKEQVIFCNITPLQREAYEFFLESKEMEAIRAGMRNTLYGIDALRKICNHPDLLSPQLKYKDDYKYGMPKKSGKMQIVRSLLQTWKKFGHKALLFSQGVQTLDILEDFVKSLGDIKYMRMDGSTAIKERQLLVDQFNNDPDFDLFLLTTKVGGLGVNLTGANRVIIFDPNWNPSTDMQARERAWRLGQKKEVTIYRLLTAGTIEEKIYHRQIQKQFLSNKVLNDPKQRATFKSEDLQDLFTLEFDKDKTETAKLFEGTEVKFNGASAGEDRPGSRQKTTEGADTTKTQSNTPNDADDRDIQAILGVDRMEEYEPEPDTKANSNEEDRIMEGLFARSGVHSALEHDKIVNGKKQLRADPRILEQEANRVAASAAASLKRASEQTQSVPIGTVTWTGEVGEAGRPSNIRRGRGGPSSAGVLAGLADRQGLDATASSSQSPIPRNNKLGVKDFEKMIPRFIKNHGGKIPTKSLIDHFNQYCKDNAKNTSNFKIALDRVAILEKKGSAGRAIWALKPGY